MNPNDKTIFNNGRPNPAPNNPMRPTPPPMGGRPGQPAPQPEEDNIPTAAKVAAGAVGGVALGAGAMFAGEAIAANSGNEDFQPLDESQLADAVSQDMDFAHVTDRMSFSQAFAAARAEVGPGGAFVWRGGVYGTYTAEEWNAMSPADRAAFTETAMEQYATRPHETVVQEVHHEVHHIHHHAPVAQNTGQTGNELNEGNIAEQLEELEGGTSPAGESEIHVVGTRTGEINGQEVDITDIEMDGHSGIAVDSDRDGSTDIVGIDMNDNGQLEENEVWYMNGDGSNPGGDVIPNTGGGEPISVVHVVETGGTTDGTTGGTTDGGPVDFEDFEGNPPDIYPDYEEGGSVAENDGGGDDNGGDFEVIGGDDTGGDEPDVYVAENTSSDGMDDFINDANVDMLA